MKNRENVILFSFVCVIFVMMSLIPDGDSKKDERQKRFIRPEIVQSEVINPQYLTGEYAILDDCGILSDGTFYISEKLVPIDTELELLIYLEETSEYDNHNYIGFQRLVNQHNTNLMEIKMIRGKNMYFAKAPYAFRNPTFYFKGKNYLHLPTDYPGLFKDEHLVSNYFGGYLLNMNLNPKKLVSY